MINPTAALDLTQLEKSISALQKSIQSYNRLVLNVTLNDDDLKTIKSGVIQNFEVSFEQCWKFMKRFVEKNFATNQTETITRKELFRICAQNNLISDIELWFKMNEARNITSHTYSEANAKFVFDCAFEFLVVAEDFFVKISQFND